MTLEQLRIFIAVAEKQHVTRAAAELNLTQSATSAAIAALEARYDVKLFDRVGRGIALTAIGREFLKEAREVMARAKSAAQVLHDLSGLKHGSMAIAASQTIGNYWLPARLDKFREAYPGLSIELAIANTEKVAQLVRTGEASLGFVEGEIADPVLVSEAFAGDSLIVVVGRNHPWAGKKKIAPKQLLDTPWILRERGSGTRAIFERGLKTFGVRMSDLEVFLELPSNEAVRAAVEAGACATAISRLVVARSLAAGTLSEIKLPLPTRSFFIVRHKERHTSNADRALLEMLSHVEA
jgi:DNA-binding transcriptional LysR family regulator